MVISLLVVCCVGCLLYVVWGGCLFLFWILLVVGLRGCCAWCAWGCFGLFGLDLVRFWVLPAVRGSVVIRLCVAVVVWLDVGRWRFGLVWSLWVGVGSLVGLHDLICS